MRTRRFKKTVLAVLMLTLAMPVQFAAAEQNTPVTTADVALSASGALSGQVLTPQGISLQNVPVVIQRDGVEVARTVTSTDGQFEITGISGGTYVVQSAGGVVVCRAWVAQTAPPVAQQGVLVVSDEQVQRGTFGPGIGPVGIMVGTFVGVAAGITILERQNNDDVAASPI